MNLYKTFCVNTPFNPKDFIMIYLIVQNNDIIHTFLYEIIRATIIFAPKLKIITDKLA